MAGEIIENFSGSKPKYPEFPKMNFGLQSNATFSKEGFEQC